jgi:hypothetical protein
MKLHRFNAEGEKQFELYLAQLRGQPNLAPPLFLLTDPSCTDEFPWEIAQFECEAASRFVAAKYLYELLSETNIAHIDRDRGLWAWLSLFYFDQLCPMKKDGGRKAGELARLIPVIGNFQRYYRHLLLGPYMIFRAHADDPERAMAVLATPLHAPGEVVAQIASRHDLVTNPSVMKVASELYVDQATGKIKKQATARAGSPRRFADVLNQFDLTYDLYSIPNDHLNKLLPREFDRLRAV